MLCHKTQQRSSGRTMLCHFTQSCVITRSDSLHSCDVWHGLQKPTSSCLQIDVTDSNLVQVLNYRSHLFTGSTETWTRIAGFRVQSAHHYTMEPNDTSLLTPFLKSSPLRQCELVRVCRNSRKSVPAFLSILSHRSVGGVVASIAAFQAVDLVPPRLELGSLDSESRVLTITPWNPTTLLCLRHSWNLLLYDNAYMFACVVIVESLCQLSCRFCRTGALVV